MLVGVVASVSVEVSGAAPPSVPGLVRISFEVSEDIPVTAQPVQPDEVPAG